MKAPTPPTQSARAIADAVRRGETAAADTVAAALTRIDDANPRLNAFIDIFHDRAADQARAIDTRIASGEGANLPLAGVPIALKDNICLSWGRTTCASKMLEHYRSPFTATAAQRLINAGAVVVGKANLDEFAMGASGEHSVFGPSRNPWDETRTCGGSSSGSACAVAAGLVPVALGSDTGGSIRQPASHTGTVGFKPTYGRVSRWGLVAFASSLDQIGPFATSVDDAALVYSIIAGEDTNDLTSSSRAVDDEGDPTAIDSADDPPGDTTCEGRPLRIGVPRFARAGGNHPAIDEALRAAIGAFKQAGAEIVEVELPHADHAIAAYYLIAPAEASSNLSRFDGVRYGHRAKDSADLEDMFVRSRTEGFGPEVRRRIMLGTHILSSGYYDAYYRTALKARRLIAGDYTRLLECESDADRLDAVLMPSAPGPAFKLGDKLDDPLALYLEDKYTAGVSLAGLPAITVPATTSDVDGVTLPAGVQLVGAHWQEAKLLRLARMLEQGV